MSKIILFFCKFCGDFGKMGLEPLHGGTLASLAAAAKKKDSQACITRGGGKSECCVIGFPGPEV